MAQDNALATIAYDDQNDAQARQLATLMTPLFPGDLKNNPDMALAVARVAVAYGLDPLMGELIPYQGKPYLTIDGRIRIADRHPAYDGYDIEPASEVERKALGAGSDQAVWKCTVYRKDRKRPTVAYGRAGGQADPNSAAKNTWTAEIAQKRAIHRALRAAFPAPIPGLEESLSPEQLRAIHAYDNDAGVTPEERSATLVDTFGVEHSNELTKDQASAYLDERVIEVDADGVIVDDFEEPTITPSPELLMAELQRRLKGAHDSASLKEVGEWAKRVGIAGVEEAGAAYRGRRDELRAAARGGSGQQELAVK